MANHVENLREHSKNHLARLHAEQARRRKEIEAQIAAHHPLRQAEPAAGKGK